MSGSTHESPNHRRSVSLHTLGGTQARTMPEVEEALPLAYLRSRAKKIEEAKFSSPSVHGILIIKDKNFHAKRKMAYMTEKAGRWFQPEKEFQGEGSEKRMNPKGSARLSEEISKTSRKNIQSMLKQKNEMFQQFKNKKFRGNILINEFWCQKHFQMVGRKTGLLGLSKKIIETRRENHKNKQEKVSKVFRSRHKELFKGEEEDSPKNSVFGNSELASTISRSHLPTLSKKENQRSVSGSKFSNQKGTPCREAIKKLLEASASIKEECLGTNEELRKLRGSVEREIEDLRSGKGKGEKPKRAAKANKFSSKVLSDFRNNKPL